MHTSKAKFLSRFEQQHCPFPDADSPDIFSNLRPSSCPIKTSKHKNQRKTRMQDAMVILGLRQAEPLPKAKIIVTKSKLRDSETEKMADKKSKLEIEEQSQNRQNVEVFQAKWKKKNIILISSPSNQAYKNNSEECEEISNDRKQTEEIKKLQKRQIREKTEGIELLQSDEKKQEEKERKEQSLEKHKVSLFNKSVRKRRWELYRNKMEGQVCQRLTKKEKKREKKLIKSNDSV